MNDRTLYFALAGITDGWVAETSYTSSGLKYAVQMSILGEVACAVKEDQATQCQCWITDIEMLGFSKLYWHGDMRRTRSILGIST